MSITLSQDEEAVLERVAIRIADRIVRNCSDKMPQVIECCVASRLAGLEYMDDIMRELPENHPLNIDQGQITEMLTSIKRDAIGSLK